jgi:hypothetical protein
MLQKKGIFPKNIQNTFWKLLCVTNILYGADRVINDRIVRLIRRL